MIVSGTAGPTAAHIVSGGAGGCRGYINPRLDWYMLGRAPPLHTHIYLEIPPSNFGSPRYTSIYSLVDHNITLYTTPYVYHCNKPSACFINQTPRRSLMDLNNYMSSGLLFFSKIFSKIPIKITTATKIQVDIFRAPSKKREKKLKL